MARSCATGSFERIWIQPAAGDAGGALGAALAAHHLLLGQPRQLPGNNLDAMQGSYLGPAFAQDDIEKRLDGGGRQVHRSRRGRA